MGKINRHSTQWLTVAEAERLIREAQPLEPAVDIYVSHLGPDGEPAPDAEIKIVRNEQARRAEPWIAGDMDSLFQQLQITPRLIFRPAITDFAPDRDPNHYTISHDEFVRLCEAYGHEVEVKTAIPPADEHAGKPVNKRKLTPKQEEEIRARYKKGSPKAALAREFKVSRRTIDRVMASQPKRRSRATWFP